MIKLLGLTLLLLTSKIYALEYVHESARKIPLLKEVDVLIIGVALVV